VRKCAGVQIHIHSHHTGDQCSDPVSTEESAGRFTQLGEKTDSALVAAREAKDAINGSFDVLIARTEHRTNEIIKVLTVASILLLPDR
jgi:Mg2+ and Co2+ transporter CorA